MEPTRYSKDQIDDRARLRALVQRGPDHTWNFYLSVKKLRAAMWATFPPLVFVRWVVARG